MSTPFGNANLPAFVLLMQSQYNNWTWSVPFVHTLICLNCLPHLNIILCCMLVVMESLSGCQLSPWWQGMRHHYGDVTLWLLSSDREVFLVRQRGATITFVDCLARWHVKIIEGSTLTSTAGQLMRSYIFWPIPLMTYYLRTRQSVWSLLALLSNQMRNTYWGISSSKGLWKYLAQSVPGCCTAELFIVKDMDEWAWHLNGIVSFVYSYPLDANLLFSYNSGIPIVIQLHLSQCSPSLNVTTLDR